MKRPKLFIDTTIFSFYHARVRASLAFAMHMATQDWWEHERMHFQLFTSATVLRELDSGEYSWKDASFRMARRITRLRETKEANDFSLRLIDERIVPPEKTGDSLLMAIATVNAVEYLLTWNHAHLANPHAQRKLEELAEKRGYKSPIMVSPLSIPQVRFGQRP